MLCCCILCLRLLKYLGMWLGGYGLLGSLSECLCSVLFDLNCLLGLLLGCLYCLWWVSARVYGVH